MERKGVREGTVKEIAQTLLRNHKDDDFLNSRRAIILIGAGCSISAGIDGAREIAQDCVQTLADKYKLDFTKGSAPSAHKALVKNNDLNKQGKSIDWSKVYAELFTKHYCSPDENREIFEKVISKADSQINWAHLVLGELTKRHYFSTIITTNFDQLALEGLVRAGILPVVSDGVESLNRISGNPPHPQLIQIHGSRHTYTLRNSDDDVKEIGNDAVATSAIQQLFQYSCALIIVGYAGNEAGIMNILINAAKNFPDKYIYWVQYDKDQDKLSDHAKNLLSKSRNSAVISGQDADGFFQELQAQLKEGIPQFIENPLSMLKENAKRISPSKTPEIQSIIDNHISEISALEQCLAESRKKADPFDKIISTAASLKVSGKTQEEYEFLKSNLPSIKKKTKTGRKQEALQLWLDVANSASYIGEQNGNEYLHFARMQYQNLLAISLPDQNSEFWTNTQNNLGNTLLTLGIRGDEDALKGAITAYENALKEWTREKVPLNWAGIQNNLGNALSTLGERGDDGAMIGAITAYKNALKEWTREKAPLNWAMTQNNLGATLSTLGERGDDDALKDAITAYENALKERTREKVPLDWAATQNNLGTALSTLGKRGDADALKDAITAYENALKERVREKVPLDWAATQNNLGTAHSTLGKRGDNDALKDAITAYKNALKEWTREKVQLHWATTQNNLGNALSTLGKHGDADALKDAITAYENALKERTREKMPLNWATTQNNLGNALSILGERGDDDTLKLAITAYKNAVEIFTEYNHAPKLEIAQNGLEKAQALLAKTHP